MEELAWAGGGQICFLLVPCSHHIHPCVLVSSIPQTHILTGAQAAHPAADATTIRGPRDLPEPGRQPGGREPGPTPPAPEGEGPRGYKSGVEVGGKEGVCLAAGLPSGA